MTINATIKGLMATAVCVSVIINAASAGGILSPEAKAGAASNAQAAGLGVGVGVGEGGSAAAINRNANRNSNVGINGQSLTNRNSNAADSASRSNARSTQAQEQSTASYADGGTANATNSSQSYSAGGEGGYSVSNGEVGVGVSTNVETTNNNTVDIPVSSAFSVIGGICNSGGSVQARDFGLSSTNVSTFCRKMTLFQVYWELGDYEAARNMLSDARNDTRYNEFFNNLKRALTLGVL